MPTITENLIRLVEEYDSPRPFDSSVDVADFLTEVMWHVRSLVEAPRKFPLSVIHTDAPTRDEEDYRNTEVTNDVLSLTWADDGTPQLHTATEQVNLTGRRVRMVIGHAR